MLAAAGLDLAVAIICLGWPPGELWPLAERWTSAAMFASAVAACSAGALTVGVAPELAFRVFLAASMSALAFGACGAIPGDTGGVARKRALSLWLAVPLIAISEWLAHPAATAARAATAPFVHVDPARLVPFGVACLALAFLEGQAIVRYWPRGQARAAVITGAGVVALGAWDIASLGGAPLPLMGAVTATTMAAAYIGWRMSAQLSVALQGIEGRVPGFALKQFLGAGGMAEVFLAEAVGFVGPARVAAVKRVRRDLVADDELCSMFIDEARLATELHHPNIVRTYACGTGRGRPYIAMELVDGLALSAIIRQRASANRAIPVATIVEIGVALCSALDYAHNLVGADGAPLGIVHRDVSSHNVLLGRDGAIKLIDFGIARARTREHHTQAGKVRGKMAYAAPEQLGGGELDRRTDVFALGVLLFELVALVRPFGRPHDTGAVRAILDGVHPCLAKLRPDARALAGPIERAIERDPGDRWENAAAFGQALRDAFDASLPGPAAVRALVDEVETEQTLGPPITSSVFPARNADSSVETVVDSSAVRSPSTPATDGE